MTAQDTIKMLKKTDRCFVGFSRLQLSTNDQAEVDLEIRLPKLEKHTADAVRPQLGCIEHLLELTVAFIKRLEVILKQLEIALIQKEIEQVFSKAGHIGD